MVVVVVVVVEVVAVLVAAVMRMVVWVFVVMITVEIVAVASYSIKPGGLSCCFFIFADHLYTATTRGSVYQMSLT